MWEFSINLKKENFDNASLIFNYLNSTVKTFKGVLTEHEENGYVSILVGVEDEYKENIKSMISSCIVEIICNKYKWNFLNKKLNLPIQNDIGLLAFKKALLNFDKETDRFIVKKSLVLERDIFLESFFYFKLTPLKNKWQELITLSNENRDYLVCKDSFIDLLKFLVDNLDIEEDEISVIKEKNSYKILLDDKIQYIENPLTEEQIVSSVIDLSPQKINLYFDENSQAITLLEKLFADRIVKSSLDNRVNNIKKIKLN